MASGDIYYIGLGSNFSLDIAFLGLLLVMAIFYLAFKVDKDERKNIWKPILLFLDTPISLAVGVDYLGYARFSVGWWIGIVFFCFAVLVGFAGLYYSLKFGKK